MKNYLHASFVICALWLFTAFDTAKANEIAVTSITLTGQNISGVYTLVQFDISWEKSWLEPVNCYFRKSLINKKVFE